MAEPAPQSWNLSKSADHVEGGSSSCGREGLPTGTCGLIGVSKAKQQVVSVGLCCLLLGMLCPLPLAAHGWYLVVRLCQLGGLALGHEPGVTSSGGSFAEP